MTWPAGVNSLALVPLYIVIIPNEFGHRNYLHGTERIPEKFAALLRGRVC